jgi:hypothetical protein
MEREALSDILTYQLDEPDARVIAKAPVLIFLLVSAADGAIDKHEIKRFESMLSSESYKDLLALMDYTKLSIINTLRLLTENPVDYLAELERVKRVLDSRLPIAMAQQVKLQLYRLGRTIANSSRTLVEERNSDHEQIALKVIAGLFGIDETVC